MKKPFLYRLCLAVGSALLCVGAGCQSNNPSSTYAWPDRNSPNRSGSPEPPRKDTPYTTATPSNRLSDREITQQIRQAVDTAEDYSAAAKHNVKITTVNGRVMLRGRVLTVPEKAGIAAMARNVAGVGNVDDQIEVPPNYQAAN